MKKIILAAAAALALLVNAAPSFAGVTDQSASIQAGGGAYDPGYAQTLRR
jgi:hypothetical protein